VASLTFDSVVVGAGIVGAACAREMADTGLRVAVCEQSDAIGSGATAAGMGHIAVMDDSDAQFALTNYSQQLWREMSSRLPADAEYMPCGSLWVAADGQEFEEVERKYRFYTERNVPVEILDEKQLRTAEPNIRPGLVGGLLMPADSVCYPPCAARYLLETPGARRIETLLRQRVVDATDSDLLTEDGTRISFGLIILATGTAISSLMPHVQVRPRKGHLLITDRYPGFLRHQLIELGYLKSAHSSTSDSVAFNAQPRLTGQILLGSSRQFGEEHTAINTHILSRMLKRAVEYLPALEDMSAIRTWTGFRAATPDKLPLVGRCPGYRNIFLATGHEGLGISTSLGTARLLRDQILNQQSAIAREPYSPERTYSHA
jgi:glycine/D-amino acid oxidase-like deaminating enzyme